MQKEKKNEGWDGGIRTSNATEGNKYLSGKKQTCDLEHDLMYWKSEA